MILRKKISFIIILTLFLTSGCSKIKQYLPVSREKVKVEGFVPEADPKVCINLPEGLNQPQNVNCFVVSVPEDRTEKRSPLVNLYVMMIKDESVSEPYADPILIMLDDPGIPIQGKSFFLTNVFLKISAMVNRAVILFDMRGSGYTTPQISCYLEKPLLFEDPDYDYQTDCVNRLENREDVTVSAYNPAEVAQDVAAIAQALGYPQINVWARGFSTSAALRLAEANPLLIRSMVLESVNTIFSNLGYATSLNGAIERALHDCEVDSECNSRFPDLKSEYEELLVRLDEKPLRTVSGLLESEDFVWDLARILKNGGFSQLPLYIHTVYTEDIEKVNDFVASYRYIPPVVFNESDVLENVYSCSEIIQDESVGSILEQLNANVNPVINSVMDDWVMNELLVNCQKWPNPGLDNSAGGRISSEVPILLVEGMYEPRFSLESAHFLNMTLGNSAIVIIPDVGRDPFLQGKTRECGINFLGSFMDNPAIVPDTSCFKVETKYFFDISPYDPSLLLDIAEFHDFDHHGITVSGLRPNDWEQLSPGRFLRRQFMNDPTGLFHIYEEGTSSDELVADFFADEGVSPQIQSEDEIVTENGLSFRVTTYAVETLEFIYVFDVAQFDSDWGGFAIILKTSNFEYNALHTDLFVPAVQQFTFY